MGEESNKLAWLRLTQRQYPDIGRPAVFCIPAGTTVSGMVTRIEEHLIWFTVAGKELNLELDGQHGFIQLPALPRRGIRRSGQAELFSFSNPPAVQATPALSNEPDRVEDPARELTRTADESQVKEDPPLHHSGNDHLMRIYGEEPIDDTIWKTPGG